MKPITTDLETQTCTRCAGSGHFSYCQMYGSICFKCGGLGWTLTKRGKVANEALRRMRSKPASELVAGDVILYEGFTAGSLRVPSKWHTVQKVEPDALNPGMLSIVCEGFRSGCGPSTMYRVRQTREQLAATMAAAVAFQSTLTKTGTVRVRKGEKS